MTTGGGWQDQIGGLSGAVKLGVSKAELPLFVDVVDLKLKPDIVQAFNERIVLIYTGKTRLARNILQVYVLAKSYEFIASVLQSNLHYPNVDYPKLLGYSKTTDSPNFFSIIYCNKTNDYSNFDYLKNSIFRSDSSVPIEEIAIKLPFKIRNPNVTHGDHDFCVWSSLIYTPQ